MRLIPCVLARADEVSLRRQHLVRLFLHPPCAIGGGCECKHQKFLRVVGGHPALFYHHRLASRRARAGGSPGDIRMGDVG